MNTQYSIRNFAIIAHIDHGKSTLADRLLELTGTVSERGMAEQILDSNPIERERGITIKLAPVRMKYSFVASDEGRVMRGNTDQQHARNPQSSTHTYILNLIDTPGHVDFGYEVSRSLAACEGAILVVDATQGVQAQTLANLAQARAQKLTVVPVLNKIDLPNARIEEVSVELGELGVDESEIIPISAKTGENVDRVLRSIVQRIPPPSGDPDAPLRALVFSSQYDVHKGVIVFVRIVDGKINYDIENHILFLASGAHSAPVELGYFCPHMVRSDGIRTGEVGYIATGLKDIRKAKVGDTITLREGLSAKNQTTHSIHSSPANRFKCQSVAESSGQAGFDSFRRPTDHKVSFEEPTIHNAQSITHNTPPLVPQGGTAERQGNPLDSNKPTIHNPQPTTILPLPGYKEPKPMVFVGLFPVQNEDINAAREAMEKLRLSDSAFTFRPINSAALGNGFHCGFLGLLHAEIVQERLVREFDLTLFATAPSVEYKVRLKGRTRGTVDGQGYTSIQSAAEYPAPEQIEETLEPVMEVRIFTPHKYIGAIMQLATDKRGEYVDLVYSGHQAEFTYLMPLSEMIVDFFDRLKSVSEGYASLDYEFFEYRPVALAKVDILVNKVPVDAFSFLSVQSDAQRRGRELVERLIKVIPRSQFAVPVQAVIGGTVIARGDIKPFRKDVTQKLYGGDRTRKDKLLEKQKKGKARMKMVGRVEIPQSAFFEVLKRD